ncbi:23S rRNA (guanine(745)-N(1))-methyltransferase [Pseudoalteromonas xiamenensis]|uniref:23S rRNA (guanine(745)-N(1))-methyltransferase n=1 Tax=Pseudoalteromonas xiamenensis TaxID=882626 RepID=UPI0035ED9AB7
MSNLFRCPICSSDFTAQDHTLVCENRHQFDRAKDGYFNLLPVQFKKSKEPGDNLEMVQARRAFLAAGHYSFLQSELVEKVKQYNVHALLDMGCGEGFYTQALKVDDLTQVYGLDISKAAVRYAAKRYPDCHFAVASCKQTPFNDCLFDGIISVFAPLFVEEAHRLLSEAGLIIQVSPGPNHLYELKSKIYSDVRLHDLPQCPSQFELVEQHIIRRDIELIAKDALNLIQMTPFAWKFRPEQLEDINNQVKIPETLEFCITVLRKRAV